METDFLVFSVMNVSKFHLELETVQRRATPWIPLKFTFILFYLCIYLFI